MDLWIDGKGVQVRCGYKVHHQNEETVDEVTIFSTVADAVKVEILDVGKVTGRCTVGELRAWLREAHPVEAPSGV